MKNWHDDSVTISNDCPWLEDSNDALLVAEKLGIPFQTVDLRGIQRKIVDYMFKEYERGRTPILMFYVTAKISLTFYENSP
jgi:tRNA-specific 2-thiouridylase